ncbi:hypothetical protein ASG01_15120 [Chryseobacterium sp. Leaf180]|uniref:hypothetical protein n=1 Tax=Chryseobacterium sp. Leaf180 TaxID=1736289 RepID=UPI0006FFFF99|nr:hypothetical protein [Chryseobacterium sp. Leaf180]KQR90443.1 hypothetical protein ASG01_15120 [Chryseobacterium sp. Leaf180]
MKKIFFLGSVLFGTFTFASNTIATIEKKLSFSSSVATEVSIVDAVESSSNDENAIKRYKTIEFDIVCNGQVGHMTATYWSNFDSGFYSATEVAAVIFQGQIQGCQQMADHGL